MTPIRTLLAVVAVGLVVLPAACAGNDNKLPDAVVAVLDKAEKVELYSLDPGRVEPGKLPAGEDFHGWRILGKTTLKEADRKAVVAALYKGIRDSDGSVAGCFNPRHGIRATYDGKTADLVICFECHSMNSYLGDQKGGALTMRSPQPTFDRVLKAAGVKLPPKAED